MISYALDFLDLKLEKYLNFNNGFFIEAGANNGILQSNTLFYEQKYNWNGLLIEPNIHNYEACKLNRPKCIIEHCALVSFNYDKEFIEGNFLITGGYNGASLMEYVVDDGDQCDEGMKTLKKNTKNSGMIIDVPAKTLTNLIKKHNINNVDLFSLDVEGYEISVLNGLDFDILSPNYILLETTSDDDRIKMLIEYMNTKNYNMVERLSNNDHLFKFKGLK